MAAKQKPRYDGHCRDLGLNDISQPHVIRFRNPQEGTVEFVDSVRGLIQFENAELDDLIIARSDGVPTYNFTVVVDDWDMRITHVIRGDDHINNTPRQINILKALGADIPQYAHVPMILGPDGKRLSKRHGADGVMQFYDMGILPHALLNYLVRLGWSHGDKEIFSREEMIEYFDPQAVSSSPAAINLEKLLWLNHHYLKTENPTYIAGLLVDYLKKVGVDPTSGPSLEEIVKIQVERCKTLVEMAERSAFFFKSSVEWNPAAVSKHITPDIIPILKALHARFQHLSEWTKENIHAELVAEAEAQGMGLGRLAQPVRIAVTGDTVSPPIDSTLCVLGRDATLSRLQGFLDFVVA
jgi:glutamyl-tRNA synthetase